MTDTGQIQTPSSDLPIFLHELVFFVIFLALSLFSLACFYPTSGKAGAADKVHRPKSAFLMKHLCPLAFSSSKKVAHFLWYWSKNRCGSSVPILQWWKYYFIKKDWRRGEGNLKKNRIPFLFTSNLASRSPMYMQSSRPVGSYQSVLSFFKNIGWEAERSSQW